MSARCPHCGAPLLTVARGSLEGAQFCDACGQGWAEIAAAKMRAANCRTCPDCNAAAEKGRREAETEVAKLRSAKP